MKVDPRVDIVAVRAVFQRQLQAERSRKGHAMTAAEAWAVLGPEPVTASDDGKSVTFEPANATGDDLPWRFLTRGLGCTVSKRIYIYPGTLRSFRSAFRQRWPRFLADQLDRDAAHKANSHVYLHHTVHMSVASKRAFDSQTACGNNTPFMLPSTAEPALVTCAPCLDAMGVRLQTADGRPGVLRRLPPPPRPRRTKNSRVWERAADLPSHAKTVQGWRHEGLRPRYEAQPIGFLHVRADARRRGQPEYEPVFRKRDTGPRPRSALYDRYTSLPVEMHTEAAWRDRGRRLKWNAVPHAEKEMETTWADGFFKMYPEIETEPMYVIEPEDAAEQRELEGAPDLSAFIIGMLPRSM